MAIGDYISEIQTSDGNTHLIGSSVWVSAEEWNGKTITEVETEIKTKFSNLTEITWSSLKSLVDTGSLIPGMHYRITDYQCTTTQDNTRSAGHPFDIIVVADDEGTLNENAHACLHTGDTYFAGCKLDAWEIWYCLDNDTTRFAWADETNGKGVIYRMIDEFDNDCPYDFKNIQFARWELSNPVGYRNDFDYDVWEDNWIQESTPFDSLLERGFWGLSSANNKFYYIYDSTDEIYKYKVEYTISGSPTYCYTFGKDTDYSINGSNYSNVIKEYKSNNTIRLNNIVFLGSDCYSNTFGGNCYSNTFGEIVEYNESEDKTIITGCTHNSFDNNCYYNTFSGNCNYNNFGNDCHNNYFGNYSYRFTEFAGCNSNAFGNECYENCFDNNCNYNTFGDKCYYNTFGDSCYYNTFGDRCYYNTFGAYCDYNTFGTYCDYNTFGDSCYYNTFGTYCNYIIFAVDSSALMKHNYYQNNHFGDGCGCIVFTGAETASNSQQVQNYNFAQGLQGTGSEYLTIDGVRNRSFETKVAKNSNGEVKVYCEADLIL